MPNCHRGCNEDGMLVVCVDDLCRAAGECFGGNYACSGIRACLCLDEEDEPFEYDDDPAPVDTEGVA